MGRPARETIQPGVAGSSPAGRATLRLNSRTSVSVTTGFYLLLGVLDVAAFS
jgi:hypothetical protein